MKKVLSLPLLLALVLLALLAAPSPLRAQSESAAIRQVMMKSAADWNRGDLDAFASCYKNSPDVLFMGRIISHGYARLLAAYKMFYKTRAQMGTLSFTDLAVQPLDARFATATGWFHLRRTAAGGKDSNGYFLLVLEKTAQGWKIVRDDSTSVPAMVPMSTHAKK